MMKNILYIISLFFIAPDIAFSSDCVLNHCNQASQQADSRLNNQDTMPILSKNSVSLLDDLEEQIISLVNNQVSRINPDLSLGYRKKTISLRYNLNHDLPDVNSYISISYGKSTVSLSYTIANW